MDTSETYIKMADHPLIQEQWKPKNWNSYHAWHKRLKEVGDIIYGRDWEHSEGELIWLPRQDQIQEILQSGYSQPSTVAVYFGLFCDNKEMYEGIYANKGYGFINKFSSMERLWLAFLMWNIYSLIWDGEKWAKEK